MLASVAFVIAVSMALYQLHRSTAIWDPLGGSQTARVLDSNVSREIRNLTGIPDSALGAIAYAGEVVLAVEDRRRRLSGQARRLSSILYGLWSASLAVAASEVIPAATRQDRGR
ncbi:MAG TPA: vitamin K epoxide reductase family protein [Thermoanaerobaculia bacterium]|nr:vitamin K epoxide reductase family protein [Thermoanaerobaculia bacterium]